MKSIRPIVKLLKNKELSTKIYLYFSTKSAGDDYDPYENNYAFTNLNPICIKGHVISIKPETAYWKQFGLNETDVKEVICEEHYQAYFELANKIVIDNKTYQVYKSGTGNRTLITKRPNKLIRVILTRKE